MTTVGYAAAPAESVAGLRRRRARHDGRPHPGAAGRQRQRRGGHDRGQRRRHHAPVRAPDEPARAPRRADPHALRRPDRARRAGNTRRARDLAKLALLVRRSAFARAVMDRPRVVLRSGARVRVLANRNTLVGAVPWVNGVKTGHTIAAGYVPRRRGPPRRRRARERRARRRRARPPATPTRSRSCAGASRATPRVTAATPAKAVARLPVTDQDREVAIVPARTVRVVARRGERPRVRRDRPARRGRGPGGPRDARRAARGVAARAAPSSGSRS